MPGTGTRELSCQEEGCNTEYKRKDNLDLFADFLGEMILKYADVIDIASLADPDIKKVETSGRTIIKDESIESKL